MQTIRQCQGISSEAARPEMSFVVDPGQQPSPALTIYTSHSPRVR